MKAREFSDVRNAYTIIVVSMENGAIMGVSLAERGFLEVTYLSERAYETSSLLAQAVGRYPSPGRRLEERQPERRQKMIYYYAWKNNEKRATMYRRLCKVVVRGALNSCLVQFLDNEEREVVSRNALRRASTNLYFM